LIIVVLTLAKASASDAPRNWSSIDPARAITDLCRAQHVSCVVDQTSSQACGLQSWDMPKEIVHVDDALKYIVTQCPMYRWRKAGVVFVYEPKNQSDSALNVRVGPVHREDEPFSLIVILAKQAKLRYKSPWPKGGGALSIVTGGITPPLKFDFDLPRDSLKNDLIRAASTAVPSWWEIERAEKDSDGVPLFKYWADDVVNPRLSFGPE
jgi:hypothetical protein